MQPSVDDALADVCERFEERFKSEEELDSFIAGTQEVLERVLLGELEQWKGSTAGVEAAVKLEVNDKELAGPSKATGSPGAIGSPKVAAPAKVCQRKQGCASPAADILVTVRDV